jgi:hypothetical protein
MYVTRNLAYFSLIKSIHWIKSTKYSKFDLIKSLLFTYDYNARINVLSNITGWRTRLANSPKSHKWSFRYSVAKSQIVAIYGIFPNVICRWNIYLYRTYILTRRSNRKIKKPYNLKVGYSRICACAGLLFMWGHRKLSSSVCARSSLISGNNEVSKICWAFLSDNPSITTYWGNMTILR